MLTQDDSLPSQQLSEPIYLGLCEKGGGPQLAARDRAIVGAMRPLSNDILCYAAARSPAEEPIARERGKFPQDQIIKIAKFGKDINDRRVPFVTATEHIFTVLQASIRSTRDVRRGRTGRRSTRLGFAAGEDSMDMADDAYGSGDQERKLATCRASEAYRREIRQYANVSPPLEIGELQLFRTAHSALQLLEAIHLRDAFTTNAARPQWGHLQEGLRQWLADNYDAPPQDEFDNFRKSLRPREHEKYWKYVYQCLLRGHFQAAISILHRHPDFQTPSSARLAGGLSENPTLVTAVERVLSQMPRPHQYPSQLDFEQKFAEWRKDIQRWDVPKLRAGTKDAEQFAYVFGILRGNEAVIHKLAEDWREALVGIILFARPTLKGHDVAELLGKLVERGVDYNDVQVQIELGIIAHEFQRVIRFCSMLDWWWLVAHMTDLLHNSGTLDDELLGPSMPVVPNKRDRCSQREWYLLNYANSLIPNLSLRRTALEYIAVCPKFGRSVLEDVIVRMSLDTVGEAPKLLEFCRRHGLDDVKNELHRRLARIEYRAGRIGEAIEHYVEARDAQKVSGLVEEIIDGYLSTANMEWLDIAGKVGQPALEFNGRLAFLARYREFHELYKAQKFREAGNLLVEMLTSSFRNDERFFPKRLLWTALLDSLPLLDMQQITVFGVDDIYELMRTLEEILTSDRRDDYLGAWEAANRAKLGIGKDRIISAEAQLEVVREALVRNLSRAFVYKGEENATNRADE
ncbi:uncharacterized protein SPPG_04691 [Spizellomyces punctatus DAOM BR117]|uniref:Nuclear pore complex protein Nup85 n=1 Tax=Spizellomyces punctatus (strain DAOM BR117) TaxID=645134 RepID=A0A0L0HFU9_SPIPD|nr:uncharacterized protein SPPG_04691 [Spizellomyces punctatus DAOM BR117]KND00366.1 hypothetical protein SPPG_04691 [Spizellomyces punctatus DAOM BR117]|eukprot:XP_016608405.1 hypothetical protein SPPG_04691 [Spizellomyces punctatus DAOM BR117]